MRHAISQRDLAAIPAVQAIFLDPFGYPDFEAWARACMDAWSAVVGADAAFMGVPDGADLSAVHGSDPRLVEAKKSYEAYYWQTDLALGTRWVEAGKPLVHHRDELYRPGDMRRDELYSDWCTPHRLFDTLGIGFDVGSVVPALINCYREKEDGRQLLLRRGKPLAELVAPAFRAGARAWLGAQALRSSVARLVDALAKGVLLYDQQGRLVHANPEARRLLEDPARGRETRARAESIATAVVGANAGALHTQFAARAGEVRLDGIRLGPGAGASGIEAAVLAEDRRDRLPDASTVSRRHGLSSRQAEVALLLAERLSDKEIARRLGIRPNTARRHSTDVLATLGLHSRREVGLALRARGPERTGG